MPPLEIKDGPWNLRTDIVRAKIRVQRHVERYEDLVTAERPVKNGKVDLSDLIPTLEIGKYRVSMDLFREDGLIETAMTRVEVE